jgi:hypothetical protein
LRSETPAADAALECGFLLGSECQGHVASMETSGEDVNG